MRILFCDDEPVVLEQLERYVHAYFAACGGAMPETASYRSGDALLRNETRADIVFLDIEMPGKNGINVGAELMRRDPHTKIFVVTAHPDYLDEAMRFHVFRYLSKPIDPKRLFGNLKDAVYQYNMETVQIPLETKDGVVRCATEDIVCFEYTGRLTTVHTVHGEYQSLKSVATWEEELTLPCFYAPYRGFLINMKYVTSFDKTVIRLKYGDKEIKAYLARRKFMDFKNKYLLYMEGMR